MSAKAADVPFPIRHAAYGLSQLSYEAGRRFVPKRGAFTLGAPLSLNSIWWDVAPQMREPFNLH
jgi:hypothetical protein